MLTRLKAPDGRWDQKRTGRAVIGLVGVAVSGGYLSVALGMPMGGAGTPGPGRFPMIVGIAAIIISLLVIGEAVLSSAGGGEIELPKGREAKNVIGFAVLTIAFILLLPLLGQYIGATLYFMAMIWFLGRIAWWKVMLYGLIAGIGTSFVFIELLGVRLPAGVILG
ncbi:tripartite tricarboxylate transporter TctB family protein [Microbacterium sp. NPDC058342]|uniref:tripartite tricarboxylate transporter TctB family protein n=1 Tax=Microbacterium sp. NPDC058342 TaxID=3346454 RepID=UPI003646DEC5